jgi:predicted nucleic acid-binding protein
MKYLLDVNALVAWEHGGSPHHAAFHLWAKKAGLRNLSSCALVELGFLRISMQVFGYTQAQAQEALADMKPHLGEFIEQAPSPLLPGWATTAAKTTDAYLVQLATTKGMRLATFDSALSDPLVVQIR